MADIWLMALGEALAPVWGGLRAFVAWPGRRPTAGGLTRLAVFGTLSRSQIQKPPPHAWSHHSQRRGMGIGGAPHHDDHPSL
jgi:hypothetical protein